MVNGHPNSVGNIVERSKTRYSPSPLVFLAQKTKGRPSQIYTGPDVMLKGPIFTPGEFMITLHREFRARDFTMKSDNSVNTSK